MPVGIDDLAIYVPKLYVDCNDFAKARGIDPQKLEHGIGIRKMAIVDVNQDPACMVGQRLLKANGEEWFAAPGYREDVCSN